MAAVIESPMNSIRRLAAPTMRLEFRDRSPGKDLRFSFKLSKDGPENSKRIVGIYPIVTSQHSSTTTYHVFYHIFFSDKVLQLLVEVARAGVALFPRARNFDQKLRNFIRDKDIQ